MTPEQQKAREKKLVSAARSVLSLQTGISVGCIRITKILYWLGVNHKDEYPIFEKFLNDTVGIPIGNERLEWETKALLKEDKKLALIENKYRNSILTACTEIISEYE